MKVLFASAPAHGHVLPMVPLMEAALDDGHEVAVVLACGMRDVVRGELPPGVVHLPGGPATPELAAEVIRRLGPPSLTLPTADGIAEFFAGALLDMAADDAVAAAREWRAGIVVAEMYSSIGPMIASALAVPWYEVRMTVPVPGDWAAAIERAAAPRYAARALMPVAPAGVLDMWPPLLHRAGEGGVPDVPLRHVRARAHRRPAAGGTPATATAARGARPTVLVTMGTAYSDQDALDTLVDAVAMNEVDVVATLGVSWQGAEILGRERSGGGGGRITFVRFTPIDELLDGVELVVSVGGAGTVLAALGRGIPLVLWPLGADQHVITGRVTEAGAAVAVDGAAQAGRAVAHLLGDSSYRRRAGRIAAEIAGAEAPGAALRDVLSGGWTPGRASTVDADRIEFRAHNPRSNTKKPAPPNGDTDLD